MKTTLEFDTDNPDHRMELARCMKSLDMACALFEIIHNAKRQCEHTIDTNDSHKTSYDGIDVSFKYISEILESHNIFIDELIS